MVELLKGSPTGKRRSGGGAAPLLPRNVLPAEATETRMSRELSALQGIPAGIVKGIGAVIQDIVPGGKSPGVLKELPGALAESIVTTGKHIFDPRLLPGGKKPKFIEDAQGTTYVEQLFNDVGNIALLGGGTALVAGKAAGGAVQASKAARAAGDVAKADLLLSKASDFQRAAGLVADKARIVGAPYRTIGRKAVTEPLGKATKAFEIASAAGEKTGKGLEIAARAGNIIGAGRATRKLAITKVKEAGAARQSAAQSAEAAVVRAAAKRLHELKPDLKSTQLDALIGEHLKSRLERLSVVDEAVAGTGVTLPTSRLTAEHADALADPQFSRLLDEAESGYADFLSKHYAPEGIEPGTFEPSAQASKAADKAWSRTKQANELREKAEGLRHQLDDVLAQRQALPGGRSPLVAARMAGGRDAIATGLRREIRDLNRQADVVEAKAASSAAKAAEESLTLDVANVPREYKPIVDLAHRAVKDMDARIWKGTGPAPKDAWTATHAARVQSEMWSSINEGIRKMEAGELPKPQYLRDYTQAQLEQQAFGRSKLGTAMRKPGQFEEAGFRKESSMQLRHKPGESELFGAADTRASGILAMAHESAQEAASNALVMDLMKEGMIRRWDPSTPIPSGYVPAATEGIERSAVESIFGDSGAQLLDPANNYIMPTAVKSQLENFASEGGRWIDKIAKPLDLFTQEWRAALLPLSPRWLANNFMGGAFIAMANGSFFDLQAWRDAGHAWKATIKVGDDLEFRVPFGSVDARLTSGGIGSDLGNVPGVVQRGRGVLANTPGVRRVIKWSENLNENTDNFFRSLSYSHELRGAAKGKMIDVDSIYAKTLAQEPLSVAERATVETALQRAQSLLVDYQNLSPFERTVMRRVIPFYAWQKGIAKLAMSLPLDHPLRFAVLEGISNHLGGFSKEERENFPDYLIPTVDTPFGALSTRGMNPFQDAAQLFIPDGSGLAASVHPIITAGSKFLLHEGGDKFGPTEPDAIGFSRPILGVQDLAAEIVGGLPQLRLESAIRNRADAPEGTKRAFSAARSYLTGLTFRTPEQMEAAQQRLVQSRQQSITSRLREDAYKTLTSRGYTLQSLAGKPTSLLARTGGLSIPDIRGGKIVPPKVKIPGLVQRPQEEQ